MKQEQSIFEKCKSIRRATLTGAAEATVYNTWSNDFKLKHVTEIPEIVTGWEKEHGSFKIDPNDMTREELEELEFGKWEEGSDLMLIPIWLHPYLDKKMNATDIFAEKEKDFGNDHRMGYLGYGVIKEKEITFIEPVTKISTTDNLFNEDSELSPMKTGDGLKREIIRDKTLRQQLDQQLQLLKAIPESEERSLSAIRLKESIMWLGMDLKRLGEINPYPNSKKPENTVVDKTADNLKL